MSKEPIKFLDTVLQQDEDNINDEKYNNQERRKFSISRSGRFKSRNKRRESLDSNLFTNNITSSSSTNNIDSQSDKIHNTDSNLTKYTENDKNEKITEQPKSQDEQNQEKNSNLKEFFETSL